VTDVLGRTWIDRAGCRHLDVDGFFPEHGERPTDDYRKACDGCPVRDDCADWAIRHERDGWWANMSPGARRRHRARNRIPFEPIEFGIIRKKAAS
jgi:WhiB family redox-sensing transcriptional regulator